MGANAYIIKPFSKDYLVARIEQLLNERKLFRERVWQLSLIHISGDIQGCMGFLGSTRV